MDMEKSKDMYQEALNNAKDDIEYCYNDFGEGVPEKRLKEIRLLQELVDKAKPMNVVNRETITIFDGSNTYDEGWEACCPSCKSTIKQSFYEEEVNYCSYCDQKLNWQQNETK